jgi:23S rRNA pseudouridine2605 synthase
MFCDNWTLREHVHFSQLETLWRRRKTRAGWVGRALSKLGYCSRSQAFEIIRSGRVRVNGSITKNPQSPVRLGQDRLEVDGEPIVSAEFVYLAMNKPRGIVTTASDEKERDTVYDCLPDGLPWWPVDV